MSYESNYKTAEQACKDLTSLLGFQECLTYVLPSTNGIDDDYKVLVMFKYMDNDVLNKIPKNINGIPVRVRLAGQGIVVY